MMKLYGFDYQGIYLLLMEKQISVLAFHVTFFNYLSTYICSQCICEIIRFYNLKLQFAIILIITVIIKISPIKCCFSFI